MWNRACPLCFAKVPRTLILTRGADLECPSCRAPLEISRASRAAAATAGLIVAFVAGRFTYDAAGESGWILGTIATVLAYGMGSAAALFFLSDLVVHTKPQGRPFPHAQK